MGASSPKVLETVTGWEAVELVFTSIVLGLWQLVKISVKRLWKGYRRKIDNRPSVELIVDPSVGTHCFIKIMGVKYHYVKTGPRSGRPVLVLGDGPDGAMLWGTHWTRAVHAMTADGYQVVTLDLRGTGGSEPGSRRELSPPRAVRELAALLSALGVSETNPVVVIGFGIGGMLTWYLAHCHGRLISKIVVVDAPHPSLYWQYPPAPFCQGALHFIQWPHFPEQWLAETALQDGKGSYRACDWTGPLNYIRGAAWYRVRRRDRVPCPALLLGAAVSAAQLVTSAARCDSATIRMVDCSADLCHTITDFLIVADKSASEPRTLVGRMLGAVTGRGRELTAKLVLPPAQA